MTIQRATAPLIVVDGVVGGSGPSTTVDQPPVGPPRVVVLRQALRFNQLATAITARIGALPFAQAS